MFMFMFVCRVLLCLSLNVWSVSPIQCGWFWIKSWVETLQEYTRFLCWQLSFNGHDVLSLQLHGESFSCSFNILIL